MSTHHSPRRSAVALLAVPLLLAAGTLTGCQSDSSHKTAALNWSTVCHGRGGNEIRSLLSGGDGAAQKTTWQADHGKHDLFINQLCLVRTSGGSVNILVATPPGVSAAQLLRKPPAPPPSPAPRSFPVAEGGHIWPDHADAVLTCHMGDGTPQGVVVDIGVNGSADKVPHREALMERLSRIWTNDLRNASYCGKKP